MTDPPRYITPPQYAEQLGVSPDKVRAWCASGAIRAIDVSEHPGVGRPRWRISPDAIAEWEEGRTAKPKTKPRRRARRKGVLDIIK